MNPQFVARRRVGIKVIRMSIFLARFLVSANVEVAGRRKWAASPREVGCEFAFGASQALNFVRGRETRSARR